MDLISIRDLEKRDVETILKMAAKKEKEPSSKTRNPKILGTFFFEPSTRTKLSFQSAALMNGMNYIDFDTQNSSLEKGETFIDTIRVLSSYVDAFVIRHPKEGSARLAAEISDKPVINGGDGGNQHPTQALIDLYSIQKTKGKISGMNVTLMGDLKHARTMRSLLYGLAMFGANVTLVSPPGLEMEKALVQDVQKMFGSEIRIEGKFDPSDTDVLYTLRVQEERFADQYEAKKIKEKFTIDLNTLKAAKSDLVILHPLPKVTEIAPEIDSTKYAKYFEQAKYGVPVRRAVLDFVLGGK